MTFTVLTPPLDVYRFNRSLQGPYFYRFSPISPNFYTTPTLWLERDRAGSRRTLSAEVRARERTALRCRVGGRRSVGIVLGQYANVLGFTSTVPILEYYTAVH